MKKVAIMTWYTYQNYGTVLQASSISFILKQLNYKPIMINYKPWGRLKKHNNPIVLFINKAVAKVYYLSKGNYNSKQKTMLFEEYKRKRIVETSRYNNFDELQSLNDIFDAIICGSDQIWSPLRYDENYFLSFVNDPNKMIAYAPSFGQTEIADLEIRKKIKFQLNRFKYLSVREIQGAKLINRLVNKNVPVVLDPTLLLSKDEWDFYAEVAKTNKLSTEYIICYFLGNSKKYIPYVEKLSKIYNMPFYIIPVKRNIQKSNLAVPFDIGPSEFVSLIKNAKHVCTDSFHGVTFSLNYNVPFTVFKRFSDTEINNQNSRITSILHTFKLENCLAEPLNLSEPIEISRYDFTNVNKILSELRDFSLRYLTRALNQEESISHNYLNKEKGIK